MRIRKRHIVAWGSAAICMVSFATASDKLAELQSHFDHETNAVRKVKALEKLGDAEFEEIRRAGTAGDYNSVGFTLEKYRDNVRAALDALKKEHPDAERQSNGYRQLEIHVRKGIHEVDEILLLAPEQYDPPIRLVRRDLVAFDDEMLRMLFPRRPEPPPAKAPDAAQTPSEKQP
jgi:hypothetical protein